MATPSSSSSSSSSPLVYMECIHCSTHNLHNSGACFVCGLPPFGNEDEFDFSSSSSSSSSSMSQLVSLPPPPPLERESKLSMNECDDSYSTDLLESIGRSTYHISSSSPLPTPPPPSSTYVRSTLSSVPLSKPPVKRIPPARTFNQPLSSSSSSSSSSPAMTKRDNQRKYFNNSWSSLSYASAGKKNQYTDIKSVVIKKEQPMPLTPLLSTSQTLSSYIPSKLSSISSSSSDSSSTSSTTTTPLIPKTEETYSYNGPYAHSSFFLYNNGFPENPTAREMTSGPTFERTIPMIQKIIQRRLDIYDLINQWIETKDYSWIDRLTPDQNGYIFLVTEEDVWDDFMGHWLVFSSLHKFRFNSLGTKIREYIIRLESELFRFRLFTSLSDRYHYLLLKVSLPNSITLTKEQVTINGGSDIIPPYTPTCHFVEWYSFRDQRLVRDSFESINKHKALIGSGAVRDLLKGDPRCTSLRYLSRGLIYLMKYQSIIVLISAILEFRVLADREFAVPQIREFTSVVRDWVLQRIAPQGSLNKSVTSVEFLYFMARNFTPPCMRRIIENKENVKIPHKYRLAYTTFVQRNGIPIREAIITAENGMRRGWSVHDADGKWNEFLLSTQSHYKTSEMRNSWVDETRNVACSTLFNIELSPATRTTKAIYGCPYRVDQYDRYNPAPPSSVKKKKIVKERDRYGQLVEAEKDFGDDTAFTCRKTCMDNAIHDIENLAVRFGKVQSSKITEVKQRTMTTTDGFMMNEQYDFWNPSNRQARLAQFAVDIGYDILNGPAGPSVKIWKKKK